MLPVNAVLLSDHSRDNSISYRIASTTCDHILHPLRICRLFLDHRQTRSRRRDLSSTSVGTTDTAWHRSTFLLLLIKSITLYSSDHATNDHTDGPSKDNSSNKPSPPAVFIVFNCKSSECKCILIEHSRHYSTGYVRLSALYKNIISSSCSCVSSL